MALWRCTALGRLTQRDHDLLMKLLDGSERSTSYDTLKHSTVDPVVQIQYVFVLTLRCAGTRLKCNRLISKPFLFSSTAVTTCQFKSAKDFTTTDVYNLIKDEGFGRYMYDGNGSGCLFWTKAVIAKLQAKNFIVAGSVDELEKAVTITRGTEGLWVPDDKGTFF